MKRIGILSDTHGTFDETLMNFFRDVDELWHAGDIGSIELADRIAACKTYQGSAYTDASALGYLERSNEARLMPPDTVRALRFLLTKLRDEGERAAFCYIKTCLRKNVPFCGQETQSGTIVGI